MTAKEYLSQAYRLNMKVDSLLEELSELKELSRSIQSPGFELGYNPNRPTDAAFEKTVMKIVDMENSINEEIDRLIDIKSNIREVINQVSDEDQQMILRKRYIHFMSWDDISKGMGFSVRWTHTLHDRALRAVEEILKNEDETCQ